MNLLRYLRNNNSYLGRKRIKKIFLIISIIILILTIFSHNKIFDKETNEIIQDNEQSFIPFIKYLGIIFVIPFLLYRLTSFYTKKRKSLYEFTKLENTQSYFKISKIFENDSKEIISCFTNIKSYPKWNTSIEKAESQSDSSKVETVNLTYDFIDIKNHRKFLSHDDKLELNFKRIKTNNQIYDLDHKREKIIRVITFEEIKIKSHLTRPSIFQNINSKSFTRINIFLPLDFLTQKHLLNNNCSYYFIQSEINSLKNNLNDYLINESFNKELLSSQAQELNRISIRIPRESFSQSQLASIKESIEIDEENKKISQSEKILPLIKPIKDHELYQTLEDFKNKQWIMMEEKSEYKTYYIDESSGFRSIKAEAVVNKNLKIVYDFAIRLDNRNQYDKNYDKGETLKQIDESNCLQYIKFKGKLMFAPRDFVINCHTSYVRYLM